MTTSTSTACPECTSEIESGPVRLGELIECGSCSAELEIISVEPVRLVLAPEIEEDWGE